MWLKPQQQDLRTRARNTAMLGNKRAMFVAFVAEFLKAGF